MERYYGGENERHLPRTYFDDHNRTLRGFDEVDKFLANTELFHYGIGRDMPLATTAPSPYLHRHAGISSVGDVGLEPRLDYNGGRDTLPRRYSRQPLLGTSLSYYNQSPQRISETRLPESSLNKVKQSPSSQSILYADETERDERPAKISYPPPVYHNYKYQYDRPKTSTSQNTDRPQSNLDTAQHFSRTEKRRKSSAFKSLRSFLKKHLKMNSHALPAHNGSDYLDGSKKISSASLYESDKPITSQQLSSSTHNINGLNSARLRTDNALPPLTRAHSFSASKARANQYRESTDWNKKSENKFNSPSVPLVKDRSAVTYPSTSSYADNGNRHTDLRMDISKSQQQTPSSQLVQKVNAGATLPRTNYTTRPPITPKETKRKPPQYETPCLYGILNHGNSCYMNAILQCLASVNRVAFLFVCKKFVISLPVSNEESSATSDNSITAVLAQTLQCMWMNANPDSHCLRLLRLIASANSHFQLSCQQDAQESLIWLLDRIHEEIKGENLSKKANSYATLHKSEEELASDALQRVSGSNYSAIMDLFQAQFRSSMECSACGFFNLTFDPYITVSLSVPPPKNSKTCTAIFVPYFNARQLVRYRISIPDMSGHLLTSTSITHIKDKIMISLGGSGDNAIACQFSANGQCYFLADDLQLGSESSSEHIDNFYVLEFPRLTAEHENQDFVVAIVTYVVGFVPSGGRRGQPYTVVISKRWNYDRIFQRLIEKGSPFMFSKDYFPLQSDFRLLIQHSSEGVIYLDPALSMPLFNYHINRAGSNRHSLLRIIVEWTSSAAYEFLRQDPEPIEDDYRFLADTQSPQNSITLLNLLQDYIKTEVIEDWKCPKCFKASSGKKELKFHSLPPVLVFHLKRFELLNDGATKKVESRLQIPLESLDMSPYVCNSESRHGTLSRSNKYNGTSYKNGFKRLEYLYDLVGVVHHFGERTNSGHYTACTRNPVDGRWRTFDDVKVTLTSTSDIRSSTTSYLLFYERRGQNLPKSSASTWFPHSVPQSVLNLYTKPSSDERRAASSINGIADRDYAGVTVHGSSTFYTRRPSTGQDDLYGTPTKSANTLNNTESSPARSRSLHNLQNNTNKGSYGTLRNYPS